MKLRDLYYKFKYRKCGAAAVAVIRGNKKISLDKSLNSAEAEIKPCRKSNEAALVALGEKYEVEPCELEQEEILEFKTNYILNYRPELIKTPLAALPGNKMPSGRELQKFTQSNHARFSEAHDFPLEKLNLSLNAHILKLYMQDGQIIPIKIICDANTDRLFAGTRTFDKALSNKEQEKLSRVFDEITLVKGVSENDIEEKNTEYISYAAAYINPH